MTANALSTKANIRDVYTCLQLVWYVWSLPCKEDVVSIISVQPRGVDWEGLAAFTEGCLEAELAQAWCSVFDACLSAIAMMHIKVQQSHPFDACSQWSFHALLAMLTMLLTSK